MILFYYYYVYAVSFSTVNSIVYCVRTFTGLNWLHRTRYRYNTISMIKVISNNRNFKLNLTLHITRTRRTYHGTKTVRWTQYTICIRLSKEHGPIKPAKMCHAAIEPNNTNSQQRTEWKRMAVRPPLRFNLFSSSSTAYLYKMHKTKCEIRNVYLCWAFSRVCVHEFEAILNNPAIFKHLFKLNQIKGNHCQHCTVHST